MNKFKMGTGENDPKKRKTSVSGKENKKPKLEKILVKTQEGSGASSQKTQTSVSVWVDQKLKTEKYLVKTQEFGGASSQKNQTSVSVWVDQKPKTEQNLVKTKSDGLQTPPSSPILRQDEFPISLKSPTHENLDEIKSCLGKYIFFNYIGI
jgi:hypothetical protein